jgi:hypothetical protein
MYEYCSIAGTETSPFQRLLPLAARGLLQCSSWLCHKSLLSALKEVPELVDTSFLFLTFPVCRHFLANKPSESPADSLIRRWIQPVLLCALRVGTWAANTVGNVNKCLHVLSRKFRHNKHTVWNNRNSGHHQSSFLLFKTKFRRLDLFPSSDRIYSVSG